MLDEKIYASNHGFDKDDQSPKKARSIIILRGEDVNGFTNAAAAWMQKSGLAGEKNLFVKY